MVTALSSVIRVSVVAPAGRVDLRLPAGVPVAEVTAELAARLGLAPDLRLQTVLGTALAPEGSVAAQISDGSVLVVDLPASGDPVVRDDIGEAVRHTFTPTEAASGQRREVVARVSARSGCGLALVVGIAAALTMPADPFAMVAAASVSLALLAAAVWSSRSRPDWAAVLVWGAAGYAAVAAYLATDRSSSPLLPGVVVLVAACAGVGMERGRSAVVPLGICGLCGLPFTLLPVGTTLVVLLLVAAIATIALPQMAVSSARVGRTTDESDVMAAVTRGHRFLLVGIASVGLVLMALVPAGMASGIATALLSADVALSFLLVARHLPRWELVCATLLSGSLAVVFGALVSMALHPTWRTPIAVLALVGAGGVAMQGVGQGVAKGRVDTRAVWFADGATWLARCALLPLGVLALGSLAELGDLVP